MKILVTGGTAQLGRPTVARLRDAGHDVRVLSRQPGNTPGDLATGAGIHSALEGVDTLVHLASAPHDALFDAARERGVAHTVYISIVGIDDIPLGYYRGKLADEKALAEFGLPNTIVRATQFHSFVERIFTAQRFSPVIVVPKFSFQPIAVEEVAARLASLAVGAPQGRVADIGGPQQLSARVLAEQWKVATGSRRGIVRVGLPGATARGFAAGHNLVPGEPYGHGTFAEYLDR